MSDIALDQRAGGEEPRLLAPGTVAILLAVGIGSFVAMLLLGAYAPDLKRGGGTGGHALSDAATGYSGLVRLADATGLHPRIVRNVHGFATEDLLVVYEPLAPVRLLTDLRERGFDWITLEPDEYLAMGCNVLCVRPGVVVMVDGVPGVREKLEARGVEVHVYDGSELSLKGDGGPTCLTCPILRA